MFSPDKPVLDLDDHAWTLRAEPVPADEVDLLDFERLLHVYHVTFDDMRKKVRRGCQALCLGRRASLPILAVASGCTCSLRAPINGLSSRALCATLQPALTAATTGDADLQQAS